jgi:hypothetical protein
MRPKAKKEKQKAKPKSLKDIYESAVDAEVQEQL